MANQKPLILSSTGQVQRLLATDLVDPAALATGTANNTTFLRGDGTWAVPPPEATSLALSSVTAATAANTIANGDNAQLWQWALTSIVKSGLTLSESTAAVNGGSSQVLLDIATLASSTATPLRVSALGSEVFRVNADGNVGIGRTAPATKLDVNGTVTATAFVGPLTGNATTATTASATTAAVTFNNGGAGAASGTTFNGSTARTISYNTIGAAASSHTHSYLPLTGGTITGSTDATTKDTGALILANGGLGVELSIYAGGNVTAYSDRRVKTNLERIPDALFKVTQLNGYTYDRTDVTMPRQTGVIAQEVLAVLPEAVVGTEEAYGVAYGNLVGLLIEAIKEQSVLIEEMKQRLAVVEAK